MPGTKSILTWALTSIAAGLMANWGGIYYIILVSENVERDSGSLMCLETLFETLECKSAAVGN